jgi:hypothetical protein
MKLVKYKDEGQDKFVWLHPFEEKWEMMISPIFDTEHEADTWMTKFKFEHAANIDFGNSYSFTK